MTAKDVFELRRQGRIEEAYDAIRSIYASDKGPFVSMAMFWTANDILKKRIGEGRYDEAQKILLAIERMLPNVPDKEKWARNAFERSHALLEKNSMRNTMLQEGPEHLQMGIWGEELAAAYLRGKGYVILERDWHSGHRDIDIIARKDEWIVFVEVKTRRNRDFLDPIDAITYEKKRNLVFAITHYIKYHKIDNPWRFDVITIVGKLGSTMPEINHIEGFNIMESPMEKWHRRRMKS